MRRLSNNIRILYRQFRPRTGQQNLRPPLPFPGPGHGQRLQHDGEDPGGNRRQCEGRDVFLIQSTCPPPNHNLMELLLMIDAVKRASARRITAVIPYFRLCPPGSQGGAPGAHHRQAGGRPPGYRRGPAHSHHGPARGADSGFFDIPVDNLYASPVMIPYIREKYSGRPGHRVAGCRGGPPGPGLRQAPGSYSRVDRKTPGRPGPGQGHEISSARFGDKEVVILDDIIDNRRHLERSGRGHRPARRPQRQRLLAPTPCSPGRRWRRVANSPLHRLVVTDTIPLSEAAQKVPQDRATPAPGREEPLCWPRPSCASTRKTP